MENETLDTEYALLERGMLEYSDYQDIPIIPSNEPLVPIDGSDTRFRVAVREDAMAVTGLAVYVRYGVRARLEQAVDDLRRRLPGAQLDIGYGYRSNKVQQDRFWAAYNALPADLPDDQKLAITHRKVAIPWVAGHPAGAAVDIAIAENNERRNFGTEMWDFSRQSYSFAPVEDIGVAARGNRMLLRTVMRNAGFAPFDGEWWHFSYGDKEWARYYGRPFAIYQQIDFQAPETSNV